MEFVYVIIDPIEKFNHGAFVDLGKAISEANRIEKEKGYAPRTIQVYEAEIKR